MRTTRKSIARVGAIAGAAAIALLANPAFGSAAVAGSAAVHVEGRSVVVEFTGISSPTLLACNGQVKDLAGQFVEGNAAWLSGNPASGTYKSPALDTGTYRVEAMCFDADGFTYLTPPGGEEVTIDGSTGSSGINLGSVWLKTGS